jgi:hypothetical protein
MFVLFWFHLVSRMFDLAYFRTFFAGVPWPHAARGHRQTFISRHAGPRIRCSCTQMLVPSLFDQSALGCRSMRFARDVLIENANFISEKLNNNTNNHHN